MQYRSIFFLLVLLYIFSVISYEVNAITVEITATVPGCGDSVIGSGEQCDGSSLGGASCSSLGFSGGSLSCSSACIFNTSQCTSDSSNGGASSSRPVSIPATNVVFTGKAYPRSTVSLLKDGQVVSTSTSGVDAGFQTTISGTSSGKYIFSIYSEDTKGVRSSPVVFPLSITSGVTTKVSDILISPTIAVDKSEVRHGDNIAIYGQSVPNSIVSISIDSDEEFLVKDTADVNGIYSLDFDTSVLEVGQYNVKSKSILGSYTTGFGKSITFTVGTKNIVTELPKVVIKGDSNGDNSVNLVDFSIVSYWYKRANPPESADLNSDGKVDLIDFSIMVFNWTG